MYGNVNFNRNYNDYQIGFGSLSQGDFWIGLLTMHHLTSQGMIVGMLRLKRPIHTGTKLSTKRLTTIGGVALDCTVAAIVSCLTFRQDQTLLDPNDNV